MGCLPYICDKEVKQILESSGILDGIYSPTAQDIQALENAIDSYGIELVSRFLDANGQHGEYTFQVLSALAFTANILGSESLLQDLSDGTRKFIGGMFELAFAVVHHDEINAIEMPTFHVAKDLHEYIRSGPDIWMRDNSVVELKSFDFHKDYYSSHANQVAEKVVDQALRRLDEGATSVAVVFNERMGEMPDDFRDAMDRLIGKEARISYRSE